MSIVWEDQGGASSCGHDIIPIIPSSSTRSQYVDCKPYQRTDELVNSIDPRAIS